MRRPRRSGAQAHTDIHREKNDPESGCLNSSGFVIPYNSGFGIIPENSGLWIKGTKK